MAVAMLLFMRVVSLTCATAEACGSTVAGKGISDAQAVFS